MCDAPRTRASLARRKKRLLSALTSLLENEVIPMTEYRRRKAHVDRLVEQWRGEMRNIRGVKKCGRPRSEKCASEPIPCRNLYCEQIVAPALVEIGMVYCSKTCAPYGHLIGEQTK